MSHRIYADSAQFVPRLCLLQPYSMPKARTKRTPLHSWLLQHINDYDDDNDDDLENNDEITKKKPYFS